MRFGFAEEYPGLKGNVVRHIINVFSPYNEAWILKTSDLLLGKKKKNVARKTEYP